MESTASVFNGAVKLGVLGGGQLGKMMAIPAANWQLPFWVLDQDKSVPAASYCTHFVAGDFKQEEDVLAFGRQVDVLTIEIEHVHTGALHRLKAEGVVVHPDPSILDIIKDKGLQKSFYTQNNLPTAPYELFADVTAIKATSGRKMVFAICSESRLVGTMAEGGRHSQ
ncbi:MAG: hypothetical protein R2795_16710 [Saprospiraceae bacterium]